MLLLLSATGLGLFAAAGLRLPLGAWSRLGVGLALGQLLLLWTPFLLARAFDASAAGAGLLASALLLLGWIPAGLSWRADPSVPVQWWAELRGGLAARQNRPALLTGGALLALLAYLHHTHYLLPRADGLYSAGVTWGDLPIHLALASRFLYADGLAALEHPLYLGGKLGYPFLPDYGAALLAAQGLSLRSAFIVGGLVPLAAIVLLLHGVVRLWLADDGTPRVTALALLLFFLAGGLGVGIVAWRVAEGAPLLAVLNATNATYIGPHVLKSSHVGNLFVAARAASSGMALGLSALLLLGHLVHAARPQRRVFALAGALGGALPLIHGHSFAVLAGVSACYALLGRRHGRRWALTLLPLVVCALPQVLWLSAQSAQGNLRLADGFLREGQSASEWLLALVLGMGLPLVLAPLALRTAQREARWLAAPLLLLLPVANVVTLTPALYENVKLLAWFDVASAVLIAHLLASWLARGRVALALIALIGCTLSGALAIGHELVNAARVATYADVRLAELVREHTAPDAVVATAASYHDPVALFAGRRVPLATPRMLGTHGIDPSARAIEVVQLYAGGPASLQVIERLGVTAVVVGPRERADLPRVDEPFLAAQAARVFEQEGQRLYVLRR